MGVVVGESAVRLGGVGETQLLGLYLSHPVLGAYKYVDLALQLGGVPTLVQ
jgi:hypothetical protein